jgi:hypothetical protein
MNYPILIDLNAEFTNPSFRVYGAESLLVTPGSIKSTEFLFPNPSSSRINASGSKDQSF